MFESRFQSLAGKAVRDVNSFAKEGACMIAGCTHPPEFFERDIAAGAGHAARFPEDPFWNPALVVCSSHRAEIERMRADALEECRVKWPMGL